MSTKTIKVWITPREIHNLEQPMGWASGLYSYEIAPPSEPATLIIGPGNHKSEDEVRAIVQDLLYDVKANHTAASAERAMLATISQHGITLT